MEESLREQVLAYARERYGTEAEYPFSGDEQSAVLRRRDNKKWYGIVMTVERARLHLPGEGAKDILNVKCDPILVGSLLQSAGYLSAYHMNKEKWITVLLDGSTDMLEIGKLLDLSWRLTASGRRRV